MVTKFTSKHIGLYESLASAIADMVRLENPNRLRISGPIWLLRLYLNTTFESSLNLGVPPNSIVGIEGPRLAKHTSNDGKVVSLEIFKDYFRTFYGCKNFTKSMAPFSNRQCGPKWFRKPYPHQSRREKDEIEKVLFACFNPTLLWTRITTTKVGLRVAPYQPNLVGRKFGVSQLLPKCLIPSAKTFFCMLDTATDR